MKDLIIRGLTAGKEIKPAFVTAWNEAAAENVTAANGDKSKITIRAGNRYVLKTAFTTHTERLAVTATTYASRKKVLEFRAGTRNQVDQGHPVPAALPPGGLEKKVASQERVRASAAGEHPSESVLSVRSHLDFNSAAAGELPSFDEHAAASAALVSAPKRTFTRAPAMCRICNHFKFRWGMSDFHSRDGSCDVPILYRVAAPLMKHQPQCMSCIVGSKPDQDSVHYF